MTDAFLIAPYEPFESRVLTPPDPGPNNALNIPVTGFLWWKLAVLQALWTNPAGVSSLVATCFLTQSNNFLGVIPAVTGIAGGTSQGVTFALGAPSISSAAQFQCQALPELYVVGDGFVGAGFDGGNAGKLISTIVILVYGVRFRKKR